MSVSKILSCTVILLAGGVSTAQAYDPAVWVSPITGGETRFYDWGYHGPNDRRANDFAPVNGFNGPSQIQHVVTTNPDRLTPDSPALFREDLNGSNFYWDANMDAQVNFYKWGYTTVAGSTFNNMQIDADGDYYIARNDMSFNWYGSLDYQYEGAGLATDRWGGVVDGVYDTNIGFQPYALSDAIGWCGSVMASHPAALEAMAGQVVFDFGFEAFLPSTPLGANGVRDPGEGSMQIVQDFGMRSYGTLEVVTSVANGGSGDFQFMADAVVNNTNPLSSPVTLTDANGNPIMIEVPVLNMDGTPALDETGNPRTMWVEQKEVGGGGVDVASYNEVSFMGGGIVPEGVWVLLADGNLPKSNDNILAVLEVDANGNPIVPEGMTGDVVWHQNSFAGYPFLLRADGIRVVDRLEYSRYTEYCGIPGACDANGNLIKQPGIAFDANGNLINLEGAIIQDLSAVSAVPVPAAVWLFGSGLIGLAGLAGRRKQS